MGRSCGYSDHPRANGLISEYRQCLLLTVRRCQKLAIYF
jgi:hypothetical protein